MIYQGFFISHDERNVEFSLCWQVAIGTILQGAARRRVMRIMRGRSRIRITAVGGGDLGTARMPTLRLDILLCRVAEVNRQNTKKRGCVVSIL